MAFLNNIYRAAGLLLLLLSSLGLTSCFEDFEPDLKSTPVVCINSRATAGDTLEVTVSRTWRWSEAPEDLLDIYLKDADVKVYVNDEFREQLKYVEENAYDRPDFSYENYGKVFKFYRGAYIPSPGDNIRITVDDPQYGHAEGEVTVPYPVEIEKVDISTFNVTTETEGNIVELKGESTLGVWLSDPADIDNFYEFDSSCTWKRTSHEVSIHLNSDLSSEPLFSEHVSPLESIMSETAGYYFFTDRQIKGRKYPLRMRLTNIRYTFLADEGTSSNESTINLTLYSISESYWKHVISVWESNDGIGGILGDAGLSDMVWESSNVSTGAGVIAARTPSTYRLKFSDLFGLGPVP